MTNKQKRFAEEYFIDLNATQAAIRAGYSPKSARSIGQENLTKPDLRAYINEHLERICTERTAEAREILIYLTAVMRGEEKTQILRMSGGGVQTIDVIDIPTRDRLRAAELLGKYYGMFKDSVSFEGAVPVIIHDDIPRDD